MARVWLFWPTLPQPHSSCWLVTPFTCVPCNREGRRHNAAAMTQSQRRKLDSPQHPRCSSVLLGDSVGVSVLKNFGNPAQISRLAELQNPQLVNAQLYSATATWRLMILENQTTNIIGMCLFIFVLSSNLIRCFYVLLACLAEAARVSTRVSWRVWCSGSLNWNGTRFLNSLSSHGALLRTERTTEVHLVRDTGWSSPLNGVTP